MKPVQEHSKMPGDHSVCVLLVISDREQQESLREMLTHSSWRVICADGLDEAVATMRSERVGVVVSSYVVRGAISWRGLLEAGRSLENPPAIVITDSRADEWMVTEVLGSGGYDIIPQPFEDGEAFFVVSAAWRYWRERGRKANVATAAGVAA